MIVGIGLNKTGTKTLRHHLVNWGFTHRSFDLDAFQSYRRGEVSRLVAEMSAHDSFEDWPWPLMFREIDQQYPDAQFVLTVRRNPESWYKSLCKMAVRMGPLNDFEKHIYGFSMPHGRMKEHVKIYNDHNAAVEDHFADRPSKLLKICWDEEKDATRLAQFLGLTNVDVSPEHINPSMPVYEGDNLMLAHVNRIVFQSKTAIKRRVRQFKRNLNGNKPSSTG